MNRILHFIRIEVHRDHFSYNTDIVEEYRLFPPTRNKDLITRTLKSHSNYIKATGHKSECYITNIIALQTITVAGCYSNCIHI